MLTIVMDFAGQSNINPRLGRLITTDAIATVTAAGYLDEEIISQNLALLTSDFIAVSASDLNGWYSPTFNGAGVCTLVAI